MKRKWFTLSALLAFTLFSSCEDDDGGMDSGNSFRIYGLPLELASGVIWQSNDYDLVTPEEYIFRDTYIGPSGQQVTDEIKGFRSGTERTRTGNFTLSLYGPGLVFNETLKAVKGKDACICFQLASENTDRLTMGKYVFGKDKAKYTFRAYVSSSYDMSGTSEFAAEILKGEVNIRENRGLYNVVFDSETVNGGQVGGEYNGALSVCRVLKDPVVLNEDISLDALLSEVLLVKMDWSGMELSKRQTLDYHNGKAFMIASTGGTRYADDNDDVNVSLVYDTETNTVRFESPIHTRTLLNHDSHYDHYCHTIYCHAPATFTDESFEKLQDFDFTVEEEDVSFSLDDFKPGYVFFLTGDGIKGVMKVKDFTEYDPTGKFIDFSWDEGWDEYGPKNPALVLDIKCPVGVQNSRIR